MITVLSARRTSLTICGQEVLRIHVFFLLPGCTITMTEPDLYILEKSNHLQSFPIVPSNKLMVKTIQESNLDLP